LTEWSGFFGGADAGDGLHMHWHIFPRRAGDTPEPGSVWKLDKSELNSDQYRLDEEELKVMKKMLNGELDQLLSSTRANFPV